MNQYTKFIFPELKKEAVVNDSSNGYDANYVQAQDTMINFAVTQHLQTIVDDTVDDVISHEEQDESSIAKISEIEVEQIKVESYNKGFDAAKEHYEPIIDQLKQEHEFTTLLERKLSELRLGEHVQCQVSTLVVDLASTISQKSHIIFPVDFEQILYKELLSRMQKFYKDGKITVTVHRTKYDLCTKLLQLDKVSENIRQSVYVAVDNTMGVDDCKIEWQDTCIEYHQAQLETEVAQILEQTQNTKEQNNTVSIL